MSTFATISTTLSDNFQKNQTFFNYLVLDQLWTYGSVGFELPILFIFSNFHMYNLTLCFFSTTSTKYVQCTNVVVGHGIAIIGVAFDYNFVVFGIVFGIHQIIFHGTMASHMFYVHQCRSVVFMWDSTHEGLQSPIFSCKSCVYLGCWTTEIMFGIQREETWV